MLWRWTAVWAVTLTSSVGSSAQSPSDCQAERPFFPATPLGLTKACGHGAQLARVQVQGRNLVHLI